MDTRVGSEPPYLDHAVTRRRPPGRVGRALRFVAMVILPVLLLAGALATFGYLRSTRPAVPVERQAERPRAVQAIAAAPGEVRPTITAFGVIAAGRSVDLRALVAGEIVSVSERLVDGGRVAEGEELLRIDPFAFEGAVIRARADLAETQGRIAELEARIRQENDAVASAREQLAITARELERLERLRASGAASERAFDEVRLRVSQVQAALDTRTNQLAIFKAQRAQLDAGLERQGFALRQAERNLADAVLRAPFAALVSNAAAERGRLVGQNDRVATLVATDRLEARFSLSDAQYARLAAAGELVGRTVEILWRAGGTEIRREARIVRVAPEARDAAFSVHAAFPGEGLPGLLRPGAFVEARLPDRAYPDALLVPAAALYEGGLFRIDEESRLRRVPAEILAHAEEGTIVRAPVAPGTRLLASRLTAPADGQLVEVRP
jgi:multidrug efflux pump subunit AcrA (membrane-fusion protein)